MIKASAILAIAFLLTFVMRKRAAAERHIVWVAAIISAALLPVLSFVLPGWQPAFAQRVIASLPQFAASANGSDVSSKRKASKAPRACFNRHGPSCGLPARSSFCS